MSATQSEQGVEHWDPRDLKEHPLQPIFFPDESEQADLELVADMETNGQRDALHILPDGTILTGHRRRKAALHLGWKAIRVIVHHELADDPAAAEALFIDDNYNRRQLSMLQKVRAAIRRVELAKLGKTVLPQECSQLKKTRDKIGWFLNIGGREADRYLRVLKAPIEVQHACDAGHLGLIEAGRIIDLPQEQQELIARQLRENGLENAKGIYDAYRPSKAATRRGAQKIWCDLRRALQEARAELVGNTRNLPWLDQDDLELIEAVEDALFAPMKIQIAEKLDDEEFELSSQDIDDLDQPDEISSDSGALAVDILSTAAGQRPVDKLSTPIVSS